MSGSRDSKSWDGFEDVAAAVEEVSDDGAEGSENTFGVSFAFAGPIVCEGLTGKSHEEQEDVVHPLVVVKV